MVCVSRSPRPAQSVASVPRPQRLVSASWYPWVDSGTNADPGPPSSHTPLLLCAHESSCSMVRVLDRKPQSAHCVLYSQIVGRKAPLPPSRQVVSSARSSSPTSSRHVLAHSVNGADGGSGGGSGIGVVGKGGGGEATTCAPVTVKARRCDRCSAAQYRPQVLSPSSAPGQGTTRWLSRSARSSVRALTSRLTSAEATPLSTSRTRSAPPSVGWPSR